MTQTQPLRPTRSGDLAPPFGRVHACRRDEDLSCRTTPQIAVVCQHYRPDGGAQGFVHRLLAAMRSQAYEVTLIARHWHERAEDKMLICNPPKLGRTWRDWGFARAVRREIRRGSFDLVQSNERIPGCHAYRAADGVHREWLRQRRRLQSPLGRLATRLSLYHAYVRRAERRLFESPSLRAVICNSNMVRAEILDHFRIEASKLRVIYNGVDTDRFHPDLKRHRQSLRAALGIAQDETVFLLVGSGFERKGVDQAMAALAKLPRGTLLVVGKDKRMARFRRRGERLGLGRRLVFAGMQQDVGAYYGAADALVLPTLYDPFPNVVFESMAAGLPVATSTKCGGAELIEPGLNGYVCDALDVDSLAAAMRRFSETDRCREMGRQARKSVEPHTLDSMRRQFTRLYEELLHEQH